MEEAIFVGSGTHTTKRRIFSVCIGSANRLMRYDPAGDAPAAALLSLETLLSKIAANQLV